MSSTQSSSTSVGVPAIETRRRISEVRLYTAEVKQPSATKVKDLVTQSHSRGNGRETEDQQSLQRGSDISPQRAYCDSLRGSAEEVTSAEGEHKEQRNSGGCCSPHTPPSRSQSSLPTAPGTPVPPCPRCRTSIPSAQASDVPPSPSLGPRPTRMHCSERELHLSDHFNSPLAEKPAEGASAVPAAQTRSTKGGAFSTSVPMPPQFSPTPAPARSSLCPRVSNEERLHGETSIVKVEGEGQAGLLAASAKNTSLGVLHAYCASTSKSLTISSLALPPPVAKTPILMPRSLTRQSSARPASPHCDTSQGPHPLRDSHSPAASMKEEVVAAVEAEGEEAGPRPCQAPPPPKQAEPVTLVPIPQSFPADVNEERDDIVSSQVPSATFALNRARHNTNATSWRFSSQVSLSSDYVDEEKGSALTNNDPFPLHGLSPSSAVVSETHSCAIPAAPLSSELRWRGWPSRLDLCSNSSSINSLQRQDVDALSYGSAPTARAERRGPLTGSLQQRSQPSQSQPRVEGTSVSRVENALFYTARSLPVQAPRTRSAADSAIVRGTRENRLGGSADTVKFPQHSSCYPRSLSSHSARYTDVLHSPADAPLLPRLNPLLRSPSSTPHFSGSQQPLTPVQYQSPTCSGSFERRVEGAEDAMLPTANTRSISVDWLSPASCAATPPAFPLAYPVQSALPSIQATPFASCHGATERGSEDTDGRTGRERRINSPHKTCVSFSVPSIPHTGERENERDTANHVCISARDGSPGDANSSVADFNASSAPPPPPPWTPAEALYWMSGRLTRREAQEMLQYDRVYYCGPALPPRTACGMTEVAPVATATPPPDTEEENAHAVSAPGRGKGVSTSTPSTAACVPVTTADTPISSLSSYFPITLGMHISFRYEVAEVLGFGTFSVVVRAIDHAAPPLSPERHCALKLIRRGALYELAAQDEWNVYEQVRACCDTAAGETECHIREAEQRAHDRHHHRFPSFTWRLSLADQRSLLSAGVLTPRSRFEFRGYHVIVFPLLGFSVRDVQELQRGCEETAAVGVRKTSGQDPSLAASRTNANSTTECSAKTSSAQQRASSRFPPLIVSSIIAQVAYALAFLHHTAHLLHGDIKPENIVFADRALSHGVAESGSLFPCPAHLPLLPRGYPTDELPAATSISSISPLRRSVSEEPTPAVENKEEEVATVCLTPAPACGAFHCLRNYASEEGSEDDGRPSSIVATAPASRELRESPPVVYAPHTPSRRVPGLATSRTSILSSPHLARQTDALTFEDSTNGVTTFATAASQASFADNTHSGELQFTRLNLNDSSTSAVSQAGPQHRVPSPSPELHNSLSASVCRTSSRVAVIDLGHAKPLAPGQAGVTFPLQSPSYRAPEMALRLPYTTSIDMWSLGCVLYELHTGHALLPNACDDATMLSSAVEVLGMPDASFLSMVKVCWKAYKQRKASHCTEPGGGSSAVLHSASCDIHPTAQEGRKRAPPYSEDPRPVSESSEEEAAVERCWKSFIQVLNITAGQQRAHAEPYRLQGTAIHAPGDLSAAISPINAQDGATAASPSPGAVDGGMNGSVGNEEVRVTTWETPAQCALLSRLFPGGQADPTEQTFTLSVAACHRLSPSAFAAVVETTSTSEMSDTQREQLRMYAWVDFLLGCLFWDSSKRLSSAEAPHHLFIATFFTAGKPKNEEEEEAQRSLAAALDETASKESRCEQLAHCSGVYYLQHHPLTARLFSASPQTQRASSGRRTSDNVDQRNSSQTPHTLSQCSLSTTALLLFLAPSVIVPFELPSSKRMAPSAHAWEEHQQQEQQRRIVVGTTLSTSGQRVSVLCERSLSPDAAHTRPFLVATNPFRVELHSINERASNGDPNLVSPSRITGEVEEEVVTSDGLPPMSQQESEVMVLRLE
ncbi:putative protein kinase [Leptomonas seymouri]|uniref:Protein kinase domain-containing protein n=1 Tax=Leptomonas seymouri TaxID=5684 RepID=A0A0N1P9R6_LEPSE|nr:putative protein kinase [Leptomonas seymouri]|eukprot:KPI83964.1 putative protein kinase [Leptomonas seymouri]